MILSRNTFEEFAAGERIDPEWAGYTPEWAVGQLVTKFKIACFFSEHFHSVKFALLE